MTTSTSNDRFPLHLTHANNNLSTPLHYGALNNQLEAVKLLVEALPAGPSRSAFVRAKNASGRDAAFEAECAGKEEVVTYLLGVLDDADLEPSGEQIEDVQADNEGGVELDDKQVAAQMVEDVESMDINKP